MKKAAFISVILIILSAVTVCYANDEQDGYLIKIKSDSSYEDVSKSNDLSIEPVVDDWNIYKISDDDADKIDMSKVDYIEPNCYFELMDAFPNDVYYSSYQSNFLNMIKVPYAWQNEFWGTGVKVAIIDSGISTTHNDLKNRIVATLDYTTTGTMAEETVHGSIVAGIIGAEINNNIGIAGVSKADLYIMKVVENEKVPLEYLIKAIADAVELYDCDVINLSLGADSIEANILNSLKDAIDKAYNNGTIVVAAAGNTGHETNLKCYPASMEHVISVAAVDANGATAYFSQYNDAVDVAAPGVKVYSTLAEGYGYASGTSFAAPHVVGISALIKGIRPNTNQDDMELMIKYSSADAGSYGYDIHYGWGIIDAEKLVKIANESEPFLHPSYITYDTENKSVEISYLNTASVVNDDSAIRLAVYDEYGKLNYISTPVNLNIASFSEEKYKFDDITIPTGGSAKIFCMNNWNALTPSAETAVFNN